MVRLDHQGPRSLNLFFTAQQIFAPSIDRAAKIFFAQFFSCYIENQSPVAKFQKLHSAAATLAPAHQKWPFSARYIATPANTLNRNPHPVISPLGALDRTGSPPHSK